MPARPLVSLDGVSVHGWKISTRKGCIISDKDTDPFRDAVGPEAKALPEMLFSSSRVTLLHEPSGFGLDFTALGGLQAWQHERLPPLQVKVAEKWQAARMHEIEAQKAVQLEYDWTFTTPYTGQVAHGSTLSQPIGPGDIGPYPAAGSPMTHTGASTSAVPSSKTAGASMQPPTAAAEQQPQQHGEGSEHTHGTGASADAKQQEQQGEAQGRSAMQASLPEWQETTEQIDRALLMERDPILFFDEVALFESDLDDNGVSQLTVKLRVMPRAWLLLLRFWLRVDGCMVRLRETRLFCRHDSPGTACVVLREQRQCEGTFAQLRAAGAPGEGPAYADGDAAAQAFQAVAPIGLKSVALHKLVLPSSS